MGNWPGKADTARAGILTRLDRRNDAVEAYRRAALTANAAERRYLRRRLRESGAEAQQHVVDKLSPQSTERAMKKRPKVPIELPYTPE